MLLRQLMLRDMRELWGVPVGPQMLLRKLMLRDVVRTLLSYDTLEARLWPLAGVSALKVIVLEAVVLEAIGRPSITSTDG